MQFASSNTYALELNVFRSGIDNDFAIFSFKQPDLASNNIDGNTFCTFFLHKFTHSLFNFDEMYLGSMTYIDPSMRYMTDAYFNMETTFGQSVSSQGNWCGRSCLTDGKLEVMNFIVIIMSKIVFPQTLTIGK